MRELISAEQANQKSKAVDPWARFSRRWNRIRPIINQNINMAINRGKYHANVINIIHIDDDDLDFIELTKHKLMSNGYIVSEEWIRSRCNITVEWGKENE